MAQPNESKVFGKQIIIIIVINWRKILLLQPWDLLRAFLYGMNNNNNYYRCGVVILNKKSSDQDK